MFNGKLHFLCCVVQTARWDYPACISVFCLALIFIFSSNRKTASKILWDITVLLAEKMLTLYCLVSTKSSVLSQTVCLSICGLFEYSWH